MKNKLYLFLSVAIITLIFMLGNWGLTDSSEARYAEIGREMFISKDYLNPTLLGIKHLHKPPQTYYLTLLGYEIFGINEFGARFFIQVALVFQLFLLFQITLLLFKNEKMAFATSLIYFSLPIVIIASRNLTTDTYLTTFILGSIYFWLRYKKQQKAYLLYLFYIFLGLIFETKGPVGFIVPITFIATHKIIYKEKIEFHIHQLLGFVIFLFVAASWYIAAIKANDGLLDYFINNQLIERISENKFKREKPFWYYLLYSPLLGLPWLFYLIPYFKNNLKSIIKNKKTEFILLITFAVFFIILTISTSKLILYILPLYFIFAIFSAKFIRESSHKTIKTISIIQLGLTILFSLLIISLYFVNNYFEINFLFSLLIFILFSGGSIAIFKKTPNSNYLKPAYLGVIFIISVIITTNYIFSKNESKINSVKPIAEFINRRPELENKILVYNYLLPSLSFYLNKNITTINHGRYTTQREIQFETNDDWKKNLINYFNTQDRTRLLKIDTKLPLYLIKRKKDKLPDTLKILKKRLLNKKEFGQFEVFY